MTLEVLMPIELADEMQKIYRDGLPPGDSTGWEDLDELYTVAPNFWTVVTGIPSHGKSSWLDNLMLNLMRPGWRFIVYSPENQPHALHLAMLIQKLKRKPFRKGYNGRLEGSDLMDAIDFLETRLRLLRLAEGSSVPDIHGVLKACEFVLEDPHWKASKVGIIIDPWNEMDHTPVAGMNETQMTNHELMFFRQWIRQRNTHGWIVAHPMKPRRDRNGNFADVGLYDINGSAAWYNKSDHGIVVRRLEDDRTEIDVQKCRFPHLGKQGTSYLQHNRGTGTYDDELTEQRRYRRYGDDDDPLSC